jgi:transcriptional regulator with XRE-family HTH domain
MALRFGRSRLPELLAAKGMSQAEFARRLKTSEAYVSRIISGKQRFGLLKAKRAARILDCYIDDLYEWED